MDNEKNIKDLIRIRKKFRASREQFGRVFLGKSGWAVSNYERGRTPIPLGIMMLARAWEQYLDALRGEGRE